MKRWLRWSLIALAGAVFLALFLSISPRYNFPSDDDMLFARSVQYLSEDGLLRVTVVSNPAVMFHILWGALFAHFLGVNYTALRLATLTLSVIGLVAFYRMLRDLAIGNRRAVLAVVVVVFNPLYFYLSLTFMSDVPFIGLMLLSLFCAVRWTQGRGYGYAIGAGVAASLSLLTRQLGIMLPLALALYMVIARPGGWRRTLAASLPAVVLPVLVLAWYILIGHTLTPGFPTEIAYQQGKASLQAAQAGGGFAQFTPSTSFAGEILDFWFGSSEGIRSLGRRAPFALEYLGWFVVPLLAAAVPAAVRAARGPCRRRWLGLIGLGLLVSAGHILYMRVIARAGFPWGEAISRYGIHPFLQGSPGPSRPVLISSSFWYLLTLLTPLPAAAFGAIYLQRLRETVARLHCWQPSDLVYLTGVGMIVLTLISPPFFDRYLTVLVPFAVLAVVERSWQPGQTLAIRLRERLRQSSMGLALACTVFLALFSVLYLQDYMAWNQARWLAGDSLLKAGVPADHIRGGYEWDVTEFYQQGLENAVAQGQRGEIFWGVWRKFVKPSYAAADYVIAFTPQPGYQIVERVPYQSLIFWPYPQAILILKK